MSAQQALETIRQAQAEVERLCWQIRREDYVLSYLFMNNQNVRVYNTTAGKALEALIAEVKKAGNIADWSPSAVAKRVAILDPWVKDGGKAVVTTDVARGADTKMLQRILDRSRDAARAAVSWLERARDAAVRSAADGKVPLNPPKAPHSPQGGGGGAPKGGSAGVPGGAEGDPPPTEASSMGILPILALVGLGYFAMKPSK